MRMSDVEVSVRGPVGWIRLNRPERLNAISRDVIIQLQATLEEFRRAGVRALVVTGTGRAFSAGADVKEWASGEADQEGPSWGALMHAFMAAFWDFPVPKIAAVNGLAYGAGCDLALACDIRIGHPDARFCEAYIRLGIPPDCGGTWLLPRVVGEARALEMILTGREVGASEAREMGLLTVLTGPEDFDATVESWADRLGHGPTVALGHARTLVREAAQRTLAEALEAEGAATEICSQTEDHREALQARAQKRSIAFRGR